MGKSKNSRRGIHSTSNKKHFKKMSHAHSRTVCRTGEYEIDPKVDDSIRCHRCSTQAMERYHWGF